MTEHEASAVAEQASTQVGMEAETTASNDPASLDTVAGESVDSSTDATSQPASKRRGKRANATDALGSDHPSLFAINIDDPELPSAAMPFTLRVEAAILLADRPISDARLTEVLGLVPSTIRVGKENENAEADSDTTQRDSAALAGRRKEALRLVREAIDTLNQQYAATNRAFRVESVAGGRQMLTIAAYGPILARMKGQRAQTRLSQAALETLAIIAYRQPMLRAQLEAIRGVACGEILRSLMERRLVKIVGRAEEVGRPMLYGTTPEFLRVFGIATLADLPQAKDLR